MAKRKKAKSKPLSPKVQQAQHRKVYFRKLVEMAHAIGVEDFELHVSPDLLRRMFDFRISNASLVAASADVPLPVLKKIREKQEEFLSHFRFSFSEEGPAVTMRDFLSVGESIYFFLTVKQTTPPPSILVEKFKDYIELVKNDNFPFRHLCESQWLTALDESTLDSKMYWIKQEYKLKNVRLLNHFELHAIRPEQKRVNIQGKARNVIRVCWAKPHDGPEWANMDCAYFDDQYMPGEKSLPVYIQPHALHRMQERLDCLKINTQHFYLFISLLEPVVCKAQKKGCLIEYRYQEQKVGYLVADMIEDMVVIRTFLFLTMDSTPEGQALQQAIGLEAVDKKYLAIDRLSTFLLSDIAKHPDIRQYFTHAGCDDLFNFEMPGVQPENQVELAHFIRTYLDKERTSVTAMAELTQEEQIGIQETAA